MLAAGVLLAANIVVPLAMGDVYPFTSAPMFRDTPQLYCNYRIQGPGGEPLPSERFLCQRIYDGNPVGYGVGVKPPRVLEEFGVAHDEGAVRRHIGEQLASAENRGYAFVDVEQEVIGPVDERRVGVVRVDRWRIEVEPESDEMLRKKGRESSRPHPGPAETGSAATTPDPVRSASDEAARP